MLFILNIIALEGNLENVERKEMGKRINQSPTTQALNDVNNLVYFLPIFFIYIYLLTGMLLRRQLVLF